MTVLLIGVPSSVAHPFPVRREIVITDGNDARRSLVLKRNGQARCNWGILRWKLYDAALYLECTGPFRR